jgi:flagellar basal body-associated protein FliL
MTAGVPAGLSGPARVVIVTPPTADRPSAASAVRSHAAQGDPTMADAQPATPPKKSLPVKTLGVVAVLMVAEAAGVIMFLGYSGSRPQKAEAHLESGDAADHEAQVEIELIADKFQNMQTGKIWVWDVEVYLKVKAKNKDFVEKELARRSAEIKEGVAQLMRRAQSSQLKEPGLESLNRQLGAYIGKVLGNDPDGNSRFERVLIPKCRGFPTE